MLKFILPVALLATAAPALAQPDGVTRHVRVSYRDLDLRRSADVHQFDQRLYAAVKAVCPDNWSDAIEVKRCREAASAEAAHQRRIIVAAARSGFQMASIAPAR